MDIKYYIQGKQVAIKELDGYKELVKFNLLDYYPELQSGGICATIGADNRYFIFSTSTAGEVFALERRDVENGIVDLKKIGKD